MTSKDMAIHLLKEIAKIDNEFKFKLTKPTITNLSRVSVVRTNKNISDFLQLYFDEDGNLENCELGTIQRDWLTE